MATPKLIAIDGPAGAGKSTVARRLAERLGWTYLDTGAMYRCVALAAIRAEAELTDEAAVAPIARCVRIELGGDGPRLDGEDVGEAIRTPEVTDAASVVSTHAEVRRATVAHQQELIGAGAWVAEGRDIGTVVAPDAPLKIYLTAEPSERARRRAAESRGDAEAIAAAMRERDRRDAGRAHGALRVAPDALELDTTGAPIDEVTGRIAVLARERGLA